MPTTEDNKNKTLCCGSSSSFFLSSGFPSFFSVLSFSFSSSSSFFFFLFFFFFFFFWVCTFFVICLKSFFFPGFCTFFFIYLKSSAKNSRFMFFWTRLLKTQDPCGINMSNSANSASKKRVFKAQDWYGTWVFKTLDASLHFSFKPILTYYILSLHNINLQISPDSKWNLHEQQLS